MTEEEKNLTLHEENLPAAEEAARKPGLVRGARDFIENTFASLKGKDMNQAVEEFTNEMTLVAEGLSEDQNVLRRDVDQAAAQLTLLEENLSRKDRERGEALSGVQDALKQAQKRADALEKRLDTLEKNLEKAVKEAERKPQKMGLGQILRQATWMIGIACGAWVIVTVLKMIGG